MLPETLPEAVGTNCTAKVVLAPGFSVCGKERPLTVIPAPEGVTAETVRAVFPEFERVMFCEALLPTLTLPKVTLEGLAFSDAVAVVPVPVKEIVSGELGALLMREIDPETLPAEVGVKTALKAAELPA
jgi:hypothetical protein